MPQVDVSPESMHVCATSVDAAGNELGRDVETLRGQVSDSGLYGGDEVGVALLQMDQAACPDALDYFRSTGELVCETSRGIDLMGGLYAHVEQDNTAEPDDIIDELATEPNKTNTPNSATRREADAALGAEANGSLPGPVKRAADPRLTSPTATARTGTSRSSSPPTRPASPVTTVRPGCRRRSKKSWTRTRT